VNTLQPSGATVGARKIPFHRPSIDDREIRAVEEVLRSGWITTGERTHDFERRFAEYVGAKHAVAMNSCTAALHVAYAAEGIGAGDEVITTPYTFIATIESICYLGAKPVLVDVDPASRNIDPSRIEAAITPRTRAIVPVHIAGLPCEMDPILEIARRRGLAVIEDAAHSLPASYKGKRIGTLSRATAFSFYATKNLTTAEGGMLVTDDDDLAARYRLLALHGITSDGWKRYRLGGKWFYEVVAMGYKYNMTDIAAALGLVQLDKLDEFDRRRQELSHALHEGLSRHPQLELPACPPHMHHAWHLYIVGVRPVPGAPSRAEFIDRLTALGIGTSVHFIPAHHHPYYAEHLGYAKGSFPRAEEAYERAVSLPLYPAMTDEDAAYVVEAVGRALNGPVD
jgi:dTDP-4-amino-4,6-dideoxygalactose transaminase